MRAEHSVIVVLVLVYCGNVPVIDSLKPKTEGLMQNQDLAGRGKKNENRFYREIEQTQPDVAVVIYSHSKLMWSK